MTFRKPRSPEQIARQMTWTAARLAIMQLGLVLTNTGCDYRVNYRRDQGGTEVTAYYTTDLEDAVDTAKAMAKIGVK